MIWNPSHIDLKKISPNLKISGEPNPSEKENYRIAIVGFGPKGLYALERMISQLRHHSIKKKISIDCYNTDDNFGNGPNYQIDQPDFILINYSIDRLNIWTDELEQIPHNQFNFTEFIDHNKIIEENPKTGDLASRSLVGIYLQNMLKIIEDNRPASVEINYVKNKVNYIEKNQQKYILNKFKQTIYDEVVITTGHSYKEPNPFPKNENYFSSSYPIKKIEDLDFPYKNVGVIGIGLTFVDTVLALTEGKGGKFFEENRKLKYLPSGDEPIIFPYSRSGLPMIPRGNPSQKNLEFKFFTNDFIENVKSEKVDFEKEILPVIIKEYHYQFYKKQSEFSQNLQLQKYIEEEFDFEEITSKFPNIEQFNFQDLLQPEISGHQNILNYLEFFLKEAEKGEDKSSWMIAAKVWRELSSLINELYSFSGFSGESQRIFDQKYFGHFNRVSYGSPKINLEKIAVLSEMNIVDFSFAQNPLIEEQNEGWKLSKNGKSINLDFLINARIAKNNLQSHLFLQLIHSGIAHENWNENYSTKSLKTDEKAYLVNEKILLQGTPMEGLTLDNESLSRNCNNFSSKWAKEVINRIQNHE